MPQIAKVGLLVPLSGPSAAVGRDLLDAATLAMFEAGVADLELLPRDTAGTPDGARRAAREALDAGATLLIGPLFSTSTEAAAAIARQQGVAMLSFSNDAGAAGAGVYVLGFRPEEQVARVVTYALDRGRRSIGLLAPSNAYGEIAMRAWRGAMNDAGRYNPSELGSYGAANEATDVVRRLIGARDGRAPLIPTNDALLIADGGTGLQSILALLGLYELDPTSVQILGTQLWITTSGGVPTEPMAEGAWLAVPDPDDAAAFSRLFERDFDRRPAAVAILAYDAVALAALIARTDTRFPPDLLVDPVGFAGRSGIFRLRPDGTTEHGLAVAEIFDGRLVPLEEAPASFPSSGAAF